MRVVVGSGLPASTSSSRLFTPMPKSQHYNGSRYVPTRKYIIYLAPIPVLGYQRGFCFDGSRYLYMFGRFTAGGDDCWKYDIKKNQFIQLADYPTVTTEAGNASTGISSQSVIYYNGCCYSMSGRTVEGGSARGTKNCFMYDPSTDSYTQLADSPYSMSYVHYQHLVWNDKIYIVGGYSYSQGAWLDYISIYDPSNDSWTTSSIGRSPVFKNPGACIYKDKIYVIGSQDSYLSVYDLTSGTWDFQYDTVPEYLPCMIPLKDRILCFRSTEQLFYYYFPEYKSWQPAGYPRYNKYSGHYLHSHAYCNDALYITASAKNSPTGWVEVDDTLVIK